MILIDGTITVDAAISEQHSQTSQVTQYPVESGATIADHVINDPFSLSLSCVVSDAPLGEVAAVREGAGDSQPSLSVYDQLQDLRDRRRAVTVTTSIQEYRNMVLTGLSIPRAADGGASLRFEATFVQISRAQTSVATVRVAIPRAVKKADVPAVASPTTGDSAPGSLLRGVETEGRKRLGRTNQDRFGRR